MISLLLIILAAVANAGMDKMEYPNILVSKFPRKWGKDVTSSGAKKVLGWKADPWHMAKSFMIICLCFAVILYRPLVHLNVTVFSVALHLVDLVIYGTVWNTVFTIFYHKLFYKPRK